MKRLILTYIFCLVMLINLLTFTLPVCEAKQGETSDQFITRCLYGGTWGWIGTGRTLKFTKETLVVPAIYSCDVIEEKASISVRFVDSGDTCDAIITPDNLMLLDPGDGSVIAMLVKMPY